MKPPSKNSSRQSDLGSLWQHDDAVFAGGISSRAHFLRPATASFCHPDRSGGISLRFCSFTRSPPSNPRPQFRATPPRTCRIIVPAGELDDRRLALIVARRTRASGRKVRTPIAATSQEPRRKGNAPGNARGLRRAFREGETRSRGHGKCHRKYTAGVIRTLRQAHGKTAGSPLSVERIWQG
jgi:hypothetical protein